MPESGLNLLVIGNYHHKNKKFVGYLKSKYNLVDDVSSANVVMSSDKYIDFENYPSIKFIIGPHFAIFGKDIKNINNVHKNIVYIQPSKWTIISIKKYNNFTEIPVISMPFGVDTHLFNPGENNKKDNILFYSKNRENECVDKMREFLHKIGVKYETFKYGGYKEDDY